MNTSILLALVLVLSACTQKPKLPNLEKRGEGNAEPGGKGSGPAEDADDKTIPEIEYPTEISLVSTKFKGEESKLSAVVKYAGSTSEKIKLSASDSDVKLSIPKLAPGKNDALVVELYEGEKLRFRATRTNTSIDKSKVNSFSIEDCLIQKLPWDGLSNETGCGWTISDVKN